MRAVTGLAARLGISNDPRGVETQDELERLSAEGCTVAPGYLLSPPHPVS